MKRLYDYILESLLWEEDDSAEDQNAANEPASDDDKEKLKKAATKIFELLKGKKKLTDYVASLNSILDGTGIKNKDNTALYLKALVGIFSGQGDASKDAYDKYTCTGEKDIPVADLYPTQSEIDITNSAKWATKDWGAKGVEDMFSGKGFGSTFPVPVLVYYDGSKNWIIDGHHRWSQLALINPKAKLHCMVIQGKESPQTFLKLTQSVIAGIMANRDKVEKLPVGKAQPDNNIFGDALKGDKLTEKVKSMFEENKENLDIVSKILEKHKDDLDYDGKFDAEGIAKMVTANRDLMIKKKQAPEKWAAPRPVMPQSDRAGKTSDKDSGADKEGSALNKLKNVKALPNI